MLGDFDFLVEIGSEDSFEKLVEGLAIPEAGDVGFTQAEGTGGQDAAVHSWVVDLEVPRTMAVELDVGQREEALYDILLFLIRSAKAGFERTADPVLS